MKSKGILGELRGVTFKGMKFIKKEIPTECCNKKMGYMILRDNPFSTLYYTICSECGHSVKLTKEEFFKT